MKFIKFCPVLCLIILCIAPLGVVSADTFNQNKTIDDTVFDNIDSMSAVQIDSFLNSFPSSCISSNSGFRAIDPTGYNPTNGYQYGGYVTAGQVIYDASQAYGLNPQVLISTLEKEQNLIIGQNNFAGYCNNGDQHKYAAAVGYGCPDSGTRYNYDNLNLYQRNGVTVGSTGTTCVNTAAKAGFSQQVIRAAWLFKFGQQRSKGNVGWAVIKGNWNNSDDPQTCYGGPMTQGTFQRCPSGAAAYYDGYTTIDGSAVHIESGGTAALYWYTPHFHGNQNFSSLFSGWFGSTQTIIPYAWRFVSENIYADSAKSQVMYPKGGRISLSPGQTIYLTIQAYNAGNQTWDKSNVHIAATAPKDRCSIFSDSSWTSCGRISMSEQTVTPSNNATFNFSITAPAQIGSYNERLNMVVEGITWMNDPVFYLPIDVVNRQTPSSAASPTLTPGQTITPNQYLSSTDLHNVLVLQGDGNLVLYSDFVPIWSNQISNPNVKKLTMQSDGNLVEYDSSNNAIWSSSTYGKPGSRLVMQTDGNIVIYSAQNSPLWSTSTNSSPDLLSYVNHVLPSNGSILYPQQTLMTANEKYKLILQGDGNLVLYSTANAVWSSNTAGKAVSYLAMQGDGNLILFDTSHRLLWSSNTGNRGISNLLLQDDGNLVVYDSGRRAVWASNTNGR